MSDNTRNYGIDLFKIISAFMIVGLHLSPKIEIASKFLTGLTFGVYIIHTQNVIYRNVLRNAFVWLAEYPFLVAILLFFISTLAVFGICAVLDWLRTLLFRAIKINKFANFIDVSIEKCIDKF